MERGTKNNIYERRAVILINSFTTKNKYGPRIILCERTFVESWCLLVRKFKTECDECRVWCEIFIIEKLCSFFFFWSLIYKGERKWRIFLVEKFNVAEKSLTFI